MSSMKFSLKLYYFLFLLSLCFASNSFAAPFFQDSFESGNLTYKQSGSGWNGSTSASVVSGQGRTGNYALRLRYDGVPSGEDSFSEQRFVFGAGRPDVYIRYYIKFPSNFVHRNESPGNNKMIRLWSDNYGDAGQVGASAWPGNKSYIGAEAQLWGCGPMGQGDLGTTWTLGAADLNKWLAFEWHFRVDNGSGNGAIELWVDGVRKFSYTNLNLCDASYFKNGYLLGWANSGFSSQTDIYIDDVEFSDTPIGLANSTPPPGLAAPKGLKITSN